MHPANDNLRLNNLIPNSQIIAALGLAVDPATLAELEQLRAYYGVTRNTELLRRLVDEIETNGYALF